MKKAVKEKKEPLIKFPEKDKGKEPYIIKTTTSIKIARIVLWIMLGFIFIRGVLDIIQPTDEKKVESTINNFRQEFKEFKGENEEIMAFAQNFAKEYLTYQEKQDDNYRARIRPYVADRIINMKDIVMTNKSTTCDYVAAYKKEQYSEHQYDVYVKAQVNYGDKLDYTTLRIPIYAKGGTYIVEGIPMLVSDSMLMANFSQPEYVGENSVTDAEKVSIEDSLSNFFKAYYEEDADVIEYYLAKDADKYRFMGLYGRYRFGGIDSIKCYRKELDKNIIAIVTLKVIDSDNGNGQQQELNVEITNQDGRYYIKDINTKIGNLNLN